MLSVLVVSKGHDYDHNAFSAMLAAMPDIEATFVDHPAAEMVLRGFSEHAYDAILFYDMCGIPGLALAHDGSGGSGQPTPGYHAAIEELLRRGVGMVLLNHATVGWANWPLWRSITGSPFMLSRGTLHGIDVPGSGYRGGHGPLPNPTLELVPEGDHAVLAGLENGFSITDEIYLKTANFGPKVVPLLRGRFDFSASQFTPPPLASDEERANWSHPYGSDLLVWANAAACPTTPNSGSPIVVSDLGDGPAAYENPHFRTLLANSLRWVASAAAREWARTHLAD